MMGNHKLWKRKSKQTKKSFVWKMTFIPIHSEYDAPSSE
jgi:hypothetical protein